MGMDIFKIGDQTRASPRVKVSHFSAAERCTRGKVFSSVGEILLPAEDISLETADDKSRGRQVILNT